MHRIESGIVHVESAVVQLGLRMAGKAVAPVVEVRASSARPGVHGFFRRLANRHRFADRHELRIASGKSHGGHGRNDDCV